MDNFALSQKALNRTNIQLDRMMKEFILFNSLLFNFQKSFTNRNNKFELQLANTNTALQRIAETQRKSLTVINDNNSLEVENHVEDVIEQVQSEQGNFLSDLRDIFTAFVDKLSDVFSYNRVNTRRDNIIDVTPIERNDTNVIDVTPIERETPLQVEYHTETIREVPLQEEKPIVQEITQSETVQEPIRENPIERERTQTETTQEPIRDNTQTEETPTANPPTPRRRERRRRGPRERNVNMPSENITRIEDESSLKKRLESVNELISVYERKIENVNTSEVLHKISSEEHDKQIALFEKNKSVFERIAETTRSQIEQIQTQKLSEAVNFGDRLEDTHQRLSEMLESKDVSTVRNVEEVSRNLLENITERVSKTNDTEIKSFFEEYRQRYETLNALAKKTVFDIEQAEKQVSAPEVSDLPLPEELQVEKPIERTKEIIEQEIADLKTKKQTIEKEISDNENIFSKEKLFLRYDDVENLNRDIISREKELENLQIPEVLTPPEHVNTEAEERPIQRIDERRLDEVLTLKAETERKLKRLEADKKNKKYKYSDAQFHRDKTALQEQIALQERTIENIRNTELVDVRDLASGNDAVSEELARHTSPRENETLRVIERVRDTAKRGVLSAIASYTRGVNRFSGDAVENALNQEIRVPVHNFDEDYLNKLILSESEKKVLEIHGNIGLREAFEKQLLNFDRIRERTRQEYENTISEREAIAEERVQNVREPRPPRPIEIDYGMSPLAGDNRVAISGDAQITPFALPALTNSLDAIKKLMLPVGKVFTTTIRSLPGGRLRNFLRGSNHFFDIYKNVSSADIRQQILTGETKKSNKAEEYIKNSHDGFMKTALKFMGLSLFDKTSNGIDSVTPKFVHQLAGLYKKPKVEKRENAEIAKLIPFITNATGRNANEIFNKGISDAITSGVLTEEQIDSLLENSELRKILEKISKTKFDVNKSYGKNAELTGKLDDIRSQYSNLEDYKNISDDDIEKLLGILKNNNAKLFDDISSNIKDASGNYDRTILENKQTEIKTVLDNLSTIRFALQDMKADNTKNGIGQAGKERLKGIASFIPVEHAKGGLVTEPTLALIGETGKPERVLSPEQTENFDALLNAVNSLSRTPQQKQKASSPQSFAAMEKEEEKTRALQKQTELLENILKELSKQKPQKNADDKKKSFLDSIIDMALGGIGNLFKGMLMKLPFVAPLLGFMNSLKELPKKLFGGLKNVLSTGLSKGKEKMGNLGRRLLGRPQVQQSSPQQIALDVPDIDLPDRNKKPVNKPSSSATKKGGKASKYARLLNASRNVPKPSNLPIKPLVASTPTGLAANLVGTVPDVSKPLGSVAEKSAEKVAGNVAKKGAGKAIAKVGAKSLGKSLLKKIPGVGAIAGLGFGLQRMMNGDFLGAAGEVASGLASTIPGLGTLASTAIDAGLAAKDFYSEMEETPDVKDVVPDASDDIISKTSEVGKTLLKSMPGIGPLAGFLMDDNPEKQEQKGELLKTAVKSLPVVGPIASMLMGNSDENAETPKENIASSVLKSIPVLGTVSKIASKFMDNSTSDVNPDDIEMIDLNERENIKPVISQIADKTSPIDIRDATQVKETVKTAFGSNNTLGYDANNPIRNNASSSSNVVINNNTYNGGNTINSGIGNKPQSEIIVAPVNPYPGNLAYGLVGAK